MHTTIGFRVSIVQLDGSMSSLSSILTQCRFLKELRILMPNRVYVFSRIRYGRKINILVSTDVTKIVL